MCGQTVLSTHVSIQNPKDHYKDDPRIWNALFELVVSDFAHLEANGLDLGSDGRLYPIIIGNKGDWSYLDPCMQYTNVFTAVCIFNRPTPKHPQRLQQ